MKSLIFILLVSTSSFAQSVQPGLWRAHSTFKVNGLDLPDSKGEDCVSSSEAKDIKKTILKKLERNGCKATKWNTKGQSIQVSLKCKKSGLDASGDLKGTITNKSYSLKGEAEGDFHEIPSRATISLNGTWMKSCQ